MNYSTITYDTKAKEINTPQPGDLSGYTFSNYNRTNAKWNYYEWNPYIFHTVSGEPFTTARSISGERLLVSVSGEKISPAVHRSIEKKFALEYPTIGEILEDKQPQQPVSVSSEPIQPTGETHVCMACLKTFTTKGSLTRHYDRTPVCVEALPQLTKAPIHSLPIHMWTNDVLERSIADDDNDLQCRYCKKTFTTTSNLHKHFQTATTCDRLACQRFRALIAQE